MSQMFIQINARTIQAAIADLTTKISDITEGSSHARRHFETIIGSAGHPDITPQEQIARLEQVRDELAQVAELVGIDEEDEDDEDEAGAETGAPPYIMDPVVVDLVAARSDYVQQLYTGDLDEEDLAALPETGAGTALETGEIHPDVAQDVAEISEAIDEAVAEMDDADDEGDDPGEDEEGWGGPPTIEGLSQAAMAVLSDYAPEDGSDRLEGDVLRIGRGIPSAHLYQAASIARGKLALLMSAIMAYESGEEAEEPDQVFLSFFEAYEETLNDLGIELDDDLVVCHAAICALTHLLENLDVAWSEGVEIQEDLHVHVLAPMLQCFGRATLH